MGRSTQVAFLFIAIILVAIMPPSITSSRTCIVPSTRIPPSGGVGLPGVPSIPGTSPGTSCPLNALKLGACVDLLGGLAHVVIGDPVVNQCCPVLQGVLQLEAALCLCTTLRDKVLNLNIYLPLALELLITCGINPLPGFNCPPLN